MTTGVRSAVLVIAATLLVCLQTSAHAQSAGGEVPADRGYGGRVQAMQARLDGALAVGTVSPEQKDIIASALRSVSVQAEELARRDSGLNLTDRQFIADRLDQLSRRYPVLGEAAVRREELAQIGGFALAPVSPEALICPGRDRVLLGVGRDRASAAVQRSMDIDLTLIAEAVASPYSAGESLTLRVRGPGLDTRIDGAPAGALLFAGATSSFSLKAGHRAIFTAEASTSGTAPHYVRIWGVCRVS